MKYGNLEPYFLRRNFQYGTKHISAIKNLLFIDEHSVINSDALSSYINTETLAILYHSEETKRNELSSILDHIHLYDNQISHKTDLHIYATDKCKVSIKLEQFILNVRRFGFVFSTDSGMRFEESMFVENANYMDEQNVKWLISAISKMNIHTIDFFGCNTLNDAQWQNYYYNLSNNANVVIYANPVSTGNPNYGGNWRFTEYDAENTRKFTVNIDRKYFNSDIEQYSYVFDFHYPITLMLDNSGAIWACGRNTAGQLGLGNNSNVANLTKLTDLNSSSTILSFGGGTSVCYISYSDGKMYASGSNASGYLLNNSVTVGGTRSSFAECTLFYTQAPSKKVIRQFSNVGSNANMMFLTDDGAVYGMGSNSAGLFGTGSTTNPASFELATMSIANYSPRYPIDMQNSGLTTILLMNDGTVWGCGANSLLGINTSTGSTLNPTQLATPVNVSGSVNIGSVKQISVSTGHVLLLTTNNKIYGTGTGASLGYGSTTNSLIWVPMDLSAVTNGIPAAISTGSNVSFVITSTGKVYGCGVNTSSVLGTGTVGTTYTRLISCLPLPSGETGVITAVTTMGFIGATIALTSTGNVYSCGSNGFGAMSISGGNSLSLTAMITASGSPMVNVKTLFINYTPIVPQLPPDSPTITYVTVATNGLSISVEFQPPTQTVNTYYYSIDGINYVDALTTVSPIIINSSGGIVSLKSYNGAGMSLASNAIRPTYPPNITNITAGLTSLLISFNMPNVGSPNLTGISYSINNGVSFTDTGTTSPLLIPELISGTTYNVILRAYSTAWVSGYSTVYNVQTAFLGSKPIIENVVSNGATSLTVTHKQDVLGSSPTTYYYSFDGTSNAGTATYPSFTITNLISNNPYNICIIANNLAGDISSNFQIGYVLGSIPSLTVTSGTNKFTISYSQQHTGTSPTTYRYYLNDISYSTPNNTSSTGTFDISNITDISSYNVYVVARNIAGDISSNIVAGNAYGTTPTISLTPGINKLTVTFNQSLRGTSPTLYYYTDLSNGAGRIGPVVSPFDISGTTTRTVYIVAQNPAGNLISLGASGTPFILGGAPTIGAITPGVNQLSIAFSQSPLGTLPTRYYYSIDGTTKLGPGTTTSPLVITDISTSITFYIIADNSAGTVRSLATSSGTPFMLGSIPFLTAVPVLNSSGAIRIAYTQETTGTLPVTYYYSTVNDANTTARTQFITTSIDVSGVTTTTTYYVIASNNAGNVISNGSTVTPYLLGSKPTISNVSQGINSLIVTFTNASGGNPSSFSYYYSYDGINREPGPITSPFTITGLTSQKTVYVIANNLAGDISSNPVTETPYLLGNPPSITNISSGINSLIVTFTNASGGNPSSFSYYYSYDGINREPGPITSPFTITGLTSQKTVYVIANNLAGDISSNPVTETPYLLGNPPSITNISSGINSLIVTFTNASGGNPSSFSYYYSYDGINREPGPITSPFTITGLTSQKTVYVIANNLAGDISSNPVTETPYLLGTPPSITNVESGTNKLTVAFTVSTGANPAPTYYYSLNGGPLNLVPSNQSPFDILNLTQAVSNSVYVLARNSAGDISSNVVSAIPYILGGAPTITRILSVANGLNVEFTGSAGGYPSPTTYYYTVDGGNAVNANTSTSPITIHNLTVVKEYTIRLFSQNSVGASPLSNALSGTPLSGSQEEVVTPATYWTLQYWSKPSFWKKSFWSKRRR